MKLNQSNITDQKLENYVKRSVKLSGFDLDDRESFDDFKSDFK